MVGEYARLMFVVYKTLVQRALDAAEGYVIATVGKDVAQALYLADAVTEYVYFVATPGKVTQ